MASGLVRLLLLRILPRRLLPILAAVELFRLVRGRRADPLLDEARRGDRWSDRSRRARSSHRLPPD